MCKSKNPSILLQWMRWLFPCNHAKMVLKAPQRWKMSEYTARDIANYFVKHSLKKKLPITNMKLQKLLYYAKAWSLAIVDAPLFSERFSAWDFGPVCPEVYDLFKIYGSSAITQPVPGGQEIEDVAAQSLLNQVWDSYSPLSAAQLSRLSHQEQPWLETHRLGVIDDNLIKNYFQGRIKR